jgi:AraC-like DNA-binding protein
MNTIFQLLILIGGLVGIVLATVLIVKTRLARLKDLFFVSFLFSLSLNNLSNYLYEAKSLSLIPGLPFPLTLAIPVFGYLYLQTLVTPVFEINFKAKGLLMFVSFELIFYFFLLIVYFVDHSFISDNDLLVNKLFQLKELMSIFLSAALIIDLLYHLRSPISKRITPRNLKWAKIFFFMCILTATCWILMYVYSFLRYDFNRTYYYPIWYLSSIVIFCSGLYAIFFNQYKSEESSNHEEHVEAKISSTPEFDYMGHFEAVMHSGKFYKKPKLTAKEFADSCEVSVNKLTKILKDNNKNFNAFVNRCRVEEAKKLLLEKDYFKYSIEAIIEEAGFNSRATFFNVFKAHTGQTPKQYREERKRTEVQNTSVAATTPS